MGSGRKHRLIEIEWPEFGESDPPPHEETVQAMDRFLVTLEYLESSADTGEEIA